MHTCLIKHISIIKIHWVAWSKNSKCSGGRWPSLTEENHPTTTKNKQIQHFLMNLDKILTFELHHNHPRWTWVSPSAPGQPLTCSRQESKKQGKVSIGLHGMTGLLLAWLNHNFNKIFFFPLAHTVGDRTGVLRSGVTTAPEVYDR